MMAIFFSAELVNNVNINSLLKNLAQAFTQLAPTNLQYIIKRIYRCSALFTFIFASSVLYQTANA